MRRSSEILPVFFRQTLENMDLDEFPDSCFLKNFPRGCCSDTCDLLSKFYASNGIKTFYVWGMYEERTHAWLKYEDYIIDITADQFLDVNEKVIVTKDKGWHSKFKNQIERHHDFENFNTYNKSRLG
ncbi:hypothetical protein KQI38_15765 [Tissierella carlieri]|uniref:Uncharacterized protein n=1 Tax=Tissierella carlieri TaxID=689904 RepID=A0ABT1SE19_9FIRM|nr:hypothetical protein [Tissierella carlieri]MBU5313479.1 hypothetical protein [Tissierella carlieri]MCQ4924732.1 hypothetical protein [Tissierella carlieri]